MSAAKKHNYPIVEVSWQDSSSDDHWQTTVDTRILDCWTAGYLVHRDKKVIVIALNCASVHSNNCCGHTMTIPMKVVTKIRRLK